MLLKCYTARFNTTLTGQDDFQLMWFSFIKDRGETPIHHLIMSRPLRLQYFCGLCALILVSTEKKNPT